MFLRYYCGMVALNAKEEVKRERSKEGRMVKEDLRMRSSEPRVRSKE